MVWSKLGVVSAPLYDSTTQRFAGMFTLADVVHLIQYYYLTADKYENVIAEVESFQLESLRSELFNRYNDARDDWLDKA